MRYKYNKSFFKTIDTEEKAYFLGLLYADGYNFTSSGSRYVVLSLQEEDKHILEDFKSALNSNNELKFRDKKSKNSNWSNIWSLQISGEEFSKHLENLGCTQAKTKILSFPSKQQVPEHLIHHFIRGYFDGDGSVWEGKRRKTMVKDAKHRNGFRERIIHNVKFNITGAPNLIIGIQNILIEKLEFSKNVINTSKNIGDCVQLEYSGRNQMSKFYKFLYRDASVYFKRKKCKFENIIKERANV